MERQAGGGSALPWVPSPFSSGALVLLTACRPWIVNFQHLLQNSPNQSCSGSTNLLPPVPGSWDLGRSSHVGNNPFCLLSYQAMREDIDVMSVYFRPPDRASVPVRSDMPAVVWLQLSTGMDSGGSLTITLWANEVGLYPAQLGGQSSRLRGCSAFGY